VKHFPALRVGFLIRGVLPPPLPPNVVKGADSALRRASCRHGESNSDFSLERAAS
jgi:hypothetical protein